MGMFWRRGGGLLPIMDYTGRLRPKEVLFQARGIEKIRKTIIYVFKKAFQNI